MKNCEEEKLDNRKRMGKNKDGVIFPVAPNLSEMSDTYLNFIEEIKADSEAAHLCCIECKFQYDLSLLEHWQSHYKKAGERGLGYESYRPHG